MMDIVKIYQSLLDFYGEQNWWPAETPFEVCVGAILTQNTSWKNVERVIKNLKQLNILSPQKIISIDSEILQEAIKPAGFYRQKTIYLKEFSKFLIKKGGFDRLKSLETKKLRDKLLQIKGVGRETADSILLYAFNKPSFVIDAYTKRLFYRLKLIQNEKIAYEELKNMIESRIRPAKENIKIYQEFHALIVVHCKTTCKKKPICDECPFSGICYNKEKNKI